MAKLSADRARALLSYEEDTGELRWKLSVGPSKAGTPAGCKTKGRWRTYIQVKVDGRLYLAHRIIWLIKTGTWPPQLVDHRNLVGTDNRWSNLRSATHAQNAINQKQKPARYTKLRGTAFDRRFNRYYARGSRGGRQVHIGTFRTETDAHEAYVSWAKANYGEFFPTGVEKRT